MSELRAPSPLGAVDDFLSTPQFARALTLTIIGVGVVSTALTRTIGWAGFIAILGSLVVLAVLSLAAQRTLIEWQGILPLSLFAFLGWATLSPAWSEYQWATVGGLAYLLAFTILGLFIAVTRDTIQIVRAFGDVLRVVLAASLVLEIFSGVLIDAPIRFLGIAGNLADLGPIQGLLSTRNQLGFVAVIAAITFGTEYRTKSVSKSLGLASLGMAAACILLSRSPVTTGVIIITLGAAAALYALRRVRADRRTFWQLALLGAVAVLLVVAWLVRGSIAAMLNGGGALDYRIDLWRQVWILIERNPLEGWGWVGPWRPDVQPFPLFATSSGHVPGSALNAYLDVWFQLGLVGLALLVGVVGLAFVRSWLLAGRRRSFVFAWPALVLVAVITTSLAESLVLADYGWLVLVVCCVKAARELSWRTALRAPALPGQP